MSDSSRKGEAVKKEEKVLFEDDFLKLRATAKPEPKKDEYGRLLDVNGNVITSRGKIGLISNKDMDEKGNPLTIEDLKSREAKIRDDESQQRRLQEEQQIMLRYEMQGRIDEYKPPAEFANNPILQHPNKTVPQQVQQADANKGEEVINMDTQKK